MASTVACADGKVLYQLCIQRLKLLSAKKEAQCKKARREIASLMEKSKLETARVVGDLRALSCGLLSDVWG